MENNEILKENRQYNLDLCKALAIIFMIICHSVLMLGQHIEGHESDWQFIFGDDIIGDYIFVAHGFMFASKNNSYYALDIVDAIGLLSIDFVLLSLFHFIIKKTGSNIYNPFIIMSKNITILYIIQWIIIGITDIVFCYLLEIVFPYWFMYLYGIILVFISYYLAKLNIFHKKKKVEEDNLINNKE